MRHIVPLQRDWVVYLLRRARNLSEAVRPVRQPPPLTVAPRGWAVTGVTPRGRMTRRRWLVLALTAAAVVAGLLAGAAWALLPRWLEDRVIRTAAERGWYLRFSDLSFSLAQVRLSDAEVRPLADSAWTLQAKTLDVSIEDFAPTELRLFDARLTSSSSLTTLWSSLASAGAATAGERIPMKIDHLEVEIGATPWLRASAGPVHTDGDRVEAPFSQLELRGMSLAPAEVTVDGDEVQGFVSITSRDAKAAAPIVIRTALRVTRGEKTTTVVGSVRTAPVLATQLPRRLAALLPDEAEVEPAVELDVELSHSPAALARANASVSVVLHKYVPPHPIELQGFDFGSKTTSTARLAFRPSDDTFDVESIGVSAGALQLRGRGWLQPSWPGAAPQAKVHLELSGELACAAVAASAIGAHSQSVFAKWAASAAKILTSGGVSIRAVVDLDTTHPEETSVRKGIGLGCGLRPLTPRRLEALAKISGVPSLPSLLPPPDELPLPKLTAPPAWLPSPEDAPGISWRLETQRDGAKRLQPLPSTAPRSSSNTSGSSPP